MAKILGKTKYISSDFAQPFRVTLESGFAAVPDNVETQFIIQQDDDSSSWAKIIGVLASGSLSVVKFLLGSGSTLQTFTGDVTAHMVYPEFGIAEGMRGIIPMGQSNGVGHNGPDANASSLGYDAILDAPDDQIVQLRTSNKYTVDNTNWLTDEVVRDTYPVATEPLDHRRANVGGSFAASDGSYYATSVGPGLTFAKLFKAYHIQNKSLICLLPSCRGSTGLITNGNAWAPPSGEMYLHACLNITTFFAENPNNRLAVFLWMQGEQEALNSGSWDIPEYSDAMATLISALRAGTDITGTTEQIAGLAELPFIIGGIQITGGQGSADIQNEQITIEANTLYCKRTIADPAWNYYEISLHTDAPGSRDRGKHWFDAYKLALFDGPVLDSRPSLVQNLQSSQEPTTVTLTWDALAAQVPVLTGYRIDFRLTSGVDADYAEFETVDDLILTSTVVSLTTDASYTFRVIGISSAGAGNEAVIVETPATDSVPVAPSSFAIGDQPTGIQLDWTALVFDPVVTSYVIQVRETGVGTFGVEIADIPIASQATATYLYTVPSSDTDYDFRMYAINSVGNGANTSTLTQSHVGSPTLAAGATLWLRAGIGEVADSTYTDRMLTWTDQSAASTSVDRPTTANYEDDIPLLNGGDGARFGNKDGWYLGAGGHFDDTPGFTVIIECTIPTLEDQNVFYGIRSFQDLRQNGTAGAIEFGSASSNTGLLVAATRVKFAMSLATDGSASFYKYDGGTATAWGTGTQTYMSALADRVSIGCRPYFNNTLMQNAYGLEGDMHSIAMIPSVLSLSDINAIMEEMV